MMEERPTEARISLSSLKANYHAIERVVAPTTKVMSIVKANGYGHGIVEVSRALKEAGTHLLGVAYIEEALELRRSGIEGSIVVLGGIYEGQAASAVEEELSIVVSDIESARSLNKAALAKGTVANVHVKVDSGMGRLGLQADEITSFFSEFKGLNNLRLEGLMSHFSESESESKSYSVAQIERFKSAIDNISSMGFKAEYVHMANSGGIFNYPNSRFNLIRPGLMLYGVYPSPALREKLTLAPVMELKSRIENLRERPKGFKVGYGSTFTTKRASKLATIPIGYGDGLPFRLSGTDKAAVIVGGRLAPIVGRICMDLTMIDVTDVAGVSNGDEVVFMGTQGELSITAEDIARSVGTIPYEILTAVTERVRRIYV